MLKLHVSSWMVFLLLPLTACAQTPAVESKPAAEVAETKSPIFADTIWLKNDMIKLGVSPSVGRITWFGFSDGDNLLWINPEEVDTPPDGDPNAWINYGGDKVWHSPQPLWPYYLPHGNAWPPDGTIDGEAWDVLQHDENRIVIRSPQSTIARVRITREIWLRGSSGISVRNEIDRYQNHPLPIQPWSVSQVQTPDQVKLSASHPYHGGAGEWVGLDSAEKFGDELTPKKHADYPQVIWTPGGQETGKKMGTRGWWITARYGDTAFHQTHFSNPSDHYAENTNVQLYVADDYVELEMLGKLSLPTRGESAVHTVSWTLYSVDDDVWERWPETIYPQFPRFMMPPETTGELKE
ncbi:MAG: DUF4380 domain-containing protein [Planctomycetota bacterium]